MSENFDLLGDPIPQGWGKRGRPQHIATQKNRCKVILLLALGWTNERIAAAIGITAPTLRKNYFRELKGREEARPRVEAGIVETLYEKARSGSVPAVKELRRHLDRADMEAGHRAFYGSEQPRPNAPATKRAPIGKKDAAREDAQTAGHGTEWGEDLSTPGLPH